MTSEPLWKSLLGALGVALAVLGATAVLYGAHGENITVGTTDVPSAVFGSNLTGRESLDFARGFCAALVSITKSPKLNEKGYSITIQYAGGIMKCPEKDH